MSCPLCGAESVGKSTLSGMEVLKCQSSQGPGGMARSEICRQREPLNKALIEACKVADIDIYNGELRVSGHKADAPDLEEWIKNREK